MISAQNKRPIQERLIVKFMEMPNMAVSINKKRCRMPLFNVALWS
jgi:hypothetical protein